MRQLIYVELKSGYNDDGPAWIGFVGSSKSGATVYFNGKAFKSLKGAGVQGNYYDLETGEEYWISGVKNDGQDRHWAGSGKIEIDKAAIDSYLTRMGLAALPRNLVPVQLASSESSPELHERENEAPLRRKDSVLGRRSIRKKVNDLVGYDPRDSHFQALKKKEISQLSAFEIQELLAYCDEMIDLVRDKKGRKSWHGYKAELSEELQRR